MNRKLYLGREKQPGLNTSGLVMECLEQLLALRPEHAPLWGRAAEVAAQYSVERIDAASRNVPSYRGLFTNTNYGAYYLVVAHRLFPGAGYGDRAVELLRRATSRADFYHLQRGQRVADLSPAIAGDDYRNTFWAEDHCCWLGAYWGLRRIPELQSLWLLPQEPKEQRGRDNLDGAFQPQRIL